MTSRRVTLTRHFQHIGGYEITAELDVLVMHDPPTRLEPGGDEVEPLALRIEGRDACMHAHADIVSDIIENEDIPAPDEREP
jgi:hypothetical protein